MNEQKWKELGAEFERGREIFKENMGKNYIQIQDELRKAKVGKENFPFNLVFKDDGLLGTYLKRYVEMDEKFTKVADFAARKGLTAENPLHNGRYICSGGRRVAFAGNYGFAGANWDLLKEMAIEIYGY